MSSSNQDPTIADLLRIGRQLRDTVIKPLLESALPDWPKPEPDLPPMPRRPKPPQMCEGCECTVESHYQDDDMLGCRYAEMMSGKVNDCTSLEVIQAVRHWLLDQKIGDQGPLNVSSIESVESSGVGTFQIPFNVGNSRFYIWVGGEVSDRI